MNPQDLQHFKALLLEQREKILQKAAEAAEEIREPHTDDLQDEVD
ncbi:MAG: conjugal transfer protein TraR, partial [Deltaproteobacteria bacterium]